MMKVILLVTRVYSGDASNQGKKLYCIIIHNNFMMKEEDTKEV